MSNKLSQQIVDDMKTAMRAKDSAALNVLRALKSAMKNAAIEKGGATAELDDAEAMAQVRKQIKQRQDSIESFKSASREDLIEKEASEIVILEKYLPAPLSEEELATLIDQAIEQTGATSRKEMGQVMKVLQETTEGRADNKSLSKAVMGKLG